ncbi:MAG: hypothetical protein EA370_05265 [Wenzhouxiangella sp.]|nr:MAG: hypothetical protein EA370_05265 [Wenzhouxiangella sp.]
METPPGRPTEQAAVRNESAAPTRFVATRVLLAIAYLGLIGLCVSLLGQFSGPLLLAFLFLILAIPAGIFGTYLATLRRIHWLGMWSTDSFAVRWLSGPWLRLALGFLMAFLTAAVLAVRLSVADQVDLTLLAICVVIVGFCLFTFGGWLRRQFQPLYQHGRSLFWVSVICAGLMSLLDPAVRYMVGAYSTYATAVEAIETARQQANWLGDSAIAQFVSGWGSSWVGLERFMLGQLVESPSLGTWFVLIISGLIRFPLYFAVSLTVCAFVLPQREYRRILLPTRPDQEPGTLSATRIAWASASATILVLFIYFPIIAVMESAISNRPGEQSPEAVVIRTVERIGDRYHEVGTVEEINRLAVSMMEERSKALASIDIALTEGFSLMRANVDPYLDWYYSLPGEWTRVATLLTGNLEDHLSDKLSASLGADEPFARFEQVFAAALHGEAEKAEEFRRLANELLNARHVEVQADDEVRVLARADRAELLSLPTHTGITTIEQRLGVTAATTGISGVVAAAATRQILVRVAARGTFRTAAVAITRLVTIRAASGAGGGTLGALIGGGIGSVVPGLGTAIGAVIGGAIGGIGVGVGAEYLILKLEEIWSRDAHRQELIASIDAAEAELRQRFSLDTPAVLPR